MSDPYTLWALVVVAAAWAGLSVCLLAGRGRTLTAHAPAILASLGILGTFLGIFVGLQDFDTSNATTIDASLDELLNGLSTAFLSSIAGIGGGLLFRGLEAFHAEPDPGDDGLGHVLKALKDQHTLLQSTQNAIAGGEESLLGQLKLLRGDLSTRSQEDRTSRKQFEADAVRIQNEQRGLLQSIRDAIRGDEQSNLAHLVELLRADMARRSKEDRKTRKEFEVALDKELKNVANTLSKSATEQVIKALEQVIKEFNEKLTEQFGENFKELNSAVAKLVEWQENYRRQLDELHRLYDASVKKIETIEDSLGRIVGECETIPPIMDQLAQAVGTVKSQTEELERHLEAFGELRDRAVRAVPETAAHVEAMSKQVADAISAASENLTKAQRDYSTNQKKTAKLLSDLAATGKTMQQGVSEIQEGATEAIRQFQADVKTALKEALDEQGKAVRRTSTNVNKQINELDEAVGKELTRVTQRMGNALGQIADTFTEDYERLTKAMERIVNRGAGGEAP